MLKSDTGAVLTRSTGRGFYYGYVVVAAGFCVWFITWGIYQSFGIFFKPLLQEFGWSRANTVLAFSLVSIVQAFLTIVMGWLTDRLGPRVVITVFGSFLGIAYLLLSQITALWQFQMFYALTAVGTSTAAIPVMATIARWFIKKRALMTGIVQSGGGVGGFIFAPFSGWLVMTYGWRSSYTILGIIALAGIIISGLLIRRDPRDSGWLPDGETRATGREDRKQGIRIQVTGLSLKQVVRMPLFWTIVGVYFSFGFCRSTFLPHIAAYVQDIGFSLADGANIVAVLTVSSILGRLSMGQTSNKAAFTMAFAVTTFALVWGMLTRQLWGLYLFALVFGVGWGAQAVLRFVMAAETFGLGSVGLLMGALGFAESTAAATGSYFAGWAFDITGSYQPAFIAGIAVSLGGVVLTYLLRKAPATGHPSNSR